MPALPDPRQELYAQHRAKGKTQVQAYELAGYVPDDGHASRMEAGNGRIGERIAELQQLSAELALIDNKWVLERLKDVAEKCMSAVEVLDQEGNRTGEWKFEHSGANKALENIGKHIGFFKEDNKQKQNKTPEEVLAEMMEKANNGST